jgi:hypothetical protein
MTVIPGDIERVAAHRLHFFWLGWLLVHGQEAGGLFGRLTGIAVMRVALFGAGGAGAGVAQPLEAEMGAMAVVPHDVHSSTGGDVDSDRLGVDHGHVDKYIQSRSCGVGFSLDAERAWMLCQQ